MKVWLRDLYISVWFDRIPLRLWSIGRIEADLGDGPWFWIGPINLHIVAPRHRA